MDTTAKFSNIFKTVQFFAVVLLVTTPIAFLILAYMLNLPETEFESIDMIQYILLFVSVFLPMVTMPIRRSFIAKANQGGMSDSQRAPMYLSMFIIIGATIEAIYVFGLVVYFLSGDIQRMLYFYPIGIAWTFMHWPTRDRFNSFVNPLGRP